MISPQYTVIRSTSNESLKELVRSDKHFFFQGSKLCLDLLSDGSIKVDLLIVLQDQQATETLPILKNVREVWLVTEKIMAKLSDMKSIPTMMIATTFRPQKIDFKKSRALLALLDVQDPGNAGTLIRTACAFGFHGVALIGSTVRLTNRKLIRSAQNAVFQIPLQHFDQFSEFATKCRQHRLPVFITSAARQKVSIGPEELTPPCCIVLGNEGSGFPAEVQSQYPSVRIPHLGKIDSLNVAVSGSILMHEIRKSWGYE